MPSSSSHHHHSSSSKGKGSSGGPKKGEPAYQRFWNWTCCACRRSGAMDTTSTPACPECQHYRCQYCFVESVKVPIHR